jgi:hypothetical protein
MVVVEEEEEEEEEEVNRHRAVRATASRSTAST